MFIDQRDHNAPVTRHEKKGVMNSTTLLINLFILPSNFSCNPDDDDWMICEQKHTIQPMGWKEIERQTKKMCKSPERPKDIIDRGEREGDREGKKSNQLVSETQVVTKYINKQTQTVWQVENIHTPLWTHQQEEGLRGFTGVIIYIYIYNIVEDTPSSSTRQPDPKKDLKLQRPLREASPSTAEVNLGLLQFCAWWWQLNNFFPCIFFYYNSLVLERPVYRGGILPPSKLLDSRVTGWVECWMFRFLEKIIIIIINWVLNLNQKIFFQTFYLIVC